MKNKKRLLSILVCLAMVLAMLPLAVSAASTTTLYCDAPDSWTNCNVYWWGAAETNPTWPGVAMAQDANGIWYYDVPSDATNVIFNNGSAQSDDLDMPTDDNVQYDYEAKAWTTYGNELEPVEVVYYLRGSMNGWDTSAPMTKQADGTYSITMDLAAGSYEYKAGTEDWGWSCPSGQNATLTLEADDSVTFTLDVDANTLTTTLGSGSVIAVDYYIVGSMNEWTQGEGGKMTDNGDGTYSVTMALTAGSYEYKANNTAGAWFPEGDNMTLTVETDCEVTFVLDAATGTITATGSGVAEPEEPTEPSEEPTDPSEEPTEPSEEPTEPEVDPESAAIIDEAYALADGESMDHEVTLTGEISAVNTAYSSRYGNITVTIVVPGSEDQPIMCYRMVGEGIEDLTVGDTITVTGTLKNFRGTIEFDAGCQMIDVVKGEGVEVPTDPADIIDAAYALEPGIALPYKATLTGEITSIDNAYSEEYGNITVTIVVPGSEDQPIVCFRMVGEGIEDLEVGDTITVVGTLKNYNGTIEFDSGCEMIDVIKGEEPIDPSEPTEPSEEPTEPSEEPTEPSEEPTEPSEEPTEPSEEPTEPSEEPTEPSEEPTEPSEEPTEPSEEPTEPSEEPTEPSEEPTEPSEEPTEPSEEPTEPSEEPTEPSEEPTEPSEEPTEPSEEPTEPSEDPEEPEESPSIIRIWQKWWKTYIKFIKAYFNFWK